YAESHAIRIMIDWIRGTDGIYMQLILYFFFSSHHHHRDLHSFPTRRSSDLPEVQRHSSYTSSDPFLHYCPYRRTVETASVRDNKDRKSTRLNSSHVAISYAVFCLKKKKKR